MYTVPHSQQLFIFFCSLGLGFIIGIFYDIFRGIRLSVSKGKAAIVVFDILFFIFSGILTYLFILAFNKGELRFYIFFGELTGAVFYYFSFGIVAIKLTDAFTGFLRKLYSLIFKIISAPFKLIFKVIDSIFSKIKEKFKKTRKKSEKMRKKHLPKLRLYVYNLFGILLINTKHKTKGGENIGKKDTKKEKKSRKHIS